MGGCRLRRRIRRVVAAVVPRITFVENARSTWRQVPPVFGASWQTVHRRFAEWSMPGCGPGEWGWDRFRDGR
ncbi:hypothetical protein D0T12_23190 [Actinomadura spongiicola]|uniref:Transposase n=1 Tax=Actinomadura spongiicola TaxID=2303421 RepID=A0A372GCM6_9ACTN|nr:hypothetical protein D0T12_23190 [Actinomadura spongiicola]